ncbi:hypothetical protein ACJJIQ_01095 [Microbulbifer sp. ANSA003]|uniref:hypothetical protein n=1 Tax=Microbulbifer sp. ANSA003 TaxID=3243360 RepID=UPI0040428F7B
MIHGDELISASKAGLKDVDFIKGNLVIPSTGEVLAQDVTPNEAFSKLESWHQTKMQMKHGKCET